MKITDVKKSLKSANISCGDTLMIHGDSAVAYQLEKEPFKKRLLIFFKQIIAYLGPNGTLIVPAFSYSFTKNEMFDIAKTESSLGTFSEFFRNFPGTVRSKHPIFSVVAIGKHQGLFANSEISDCFGKDTCFDLLHKLDGKVMNLGCDFDITYTHYVEQNLGVSYRYFKNFYGTIKSGKDISNCTTKYFVGNPQIKYKQNLNRLKKILLSKDKLKIIPFGRLASFTVSCKDFFKYAKLYVNKNKYFLIQEGDFD